MPEAAGRDGRCRGDAITLDAIDLRIIHALQIQPRAPWKLVGVAVGVDPVTASRRWHRMNAAGAAWISCFPRLSEPRAVTAIVEVQCAAGRTEEVALELAGDPHARTLQIQSGTFDIGIVVATSTSRDLVRYVLRRVAKVPGVTSVRTMPILSALRNITQWRLTALDEAGEKRLLPRAAPAGPRTTSEDLDWGVIAALSQNPRITVGELAEALSVSTATARRRLESAVSSQVDLMCEMALPLSPWPVQVTLWASCRGERLTSIAREIGAAPGVIAVFATHGESNLDIAFRAGSLEKLRQFEAALTSRHPDLDINERLLVLRLVKFGGQILDEHGFAATYVPIDIREDPVPPDSEVDLPIA